MTDGASLLELDALTSEESLRVHMYKCAMTFQSKSTEYPTVDSIASAFFDFVKGERWRLEVLDVALHRVSRHTTVESALKKAQEIADWVKPAPPPPPPPTGNGTLDEITSPTTKKKAGVTKK